MGYLKLPEGKRIAVNLGVDVDAQEVIKGSRAGDVVLHAAQRI